MSERINVGELQKAIARLGDVFVTKDVSEQDELKRAHPAESSHSQWHAFVGRAISTRRAELGVESIGKSSRGERWSKRVSAARPSAPIDAGPPPPAPDPHDFGPQYSGDPPFTARHRLHQSWWRATVLGVPCGPGPRETSPSRYGNMLDAASGAAGMNFLAPEIFAVAKARLAEGGGTVERFRLLHNMLSSQPMCFNLFGPLVGHPERAVRLLRPLLEDDVARVRRVAIEWAPAPATSYLGDRTAFDAMIEYERADGSLVLVGIETKLTDSFSQKPYDGEVYRRWMRSPRSPYRTEAWGEVASPRHNQLWRNHLLAIAARDLPGSRYAAVKSMAVLHPGDEEGARVVASYRNLLRPDDDTFAARTLDEVVATFTSVAHADEVPWLDAFRRRYLALDLSDDAWRATSRSVSGSQST